jgi:hypothetical protein
MLREVSVIDARVVRDVAHKKTRLAPGFFQGTVITLDQSSSP